MVASTSASVLRAACFADAVRRVAAHVGRRGIPRIHRLDADVAVLESRRVRFFGYIGRTFFHFTRRHVATVGGRVGRPIRSGVACIAAGAIRFEIELERQAARERQGP
jgi:hypothetical protein